MIEKENLPSKTPQELFGPEGVFQERNGVQGYLRVASELIYIQGRVSDKGLTMIAEGTADKDWGTLFSINEEGKSYEECVLMHDFPPGDNEGIWIPAHNLDRFEELIGVEEEAAG